MILTREKIRVNNISIGNQYGIPNRITLDIIPPKAGWLWQVETITFQFDTPGPDFHAAVVVVNPKLELEISGAAINIPLPLIQRAYDGVVIWPLALIDIEPPLQSGSINYGASQTITWRDSIRIALTGGFTRNESFIPNTIDMSMAVTVWGSRERVQ